MKPAVGTGEIQLGVGADKLTEGLKKTQKDIDQWGKTLNVKVIAQGKGLKGHIAQGLATGLAAGLAGGLVKGLFGAAGNYAGQRARAPRPVAPGVPKGMQVKPQPLISEEDEVRLQRIDAAHQKVALAQQTLSFKMKAAMADPIEKWSEVVTAWIERFTPILTTLANQWGSLMAVGAHVVGAIAEVIGTVLGAALKLILPILEKIATILDVIAFVIGEVLSAAIEVFAEAVNGVADWIMELFNLKSVTMTVSDVVFGCFRMIGAGVAYVWDTLKAGAGVVALVAGVMVRGFATIIDAIGEAVKALAELAETLPESIRPGWVKDAANAVSGWAVSVDRAGDGITAWGNNAITSWGESAAKVDGFFDRIEEKWRNRNKKTAAAVGFALPSSDPAGAMLRGSTEAHTVIARFQNQSMVERNLTKQQLDQLKGINKGVQDMNKKPAVNLKPV